MYLLQGHKREMIAHLMGISPWTVVCYCKNVYTKLGIHSKIELTSRLGEFALEFHQAHVDGAIDLRLLLRKGVKYISVNSRIIIAGFLLLVLSGSFLGNQEQFCRVRTRAISRSVTRTRRYYE